MHLHLQNSLEGGFWSGGRIAGIVAANGLVLSPHPTAEQPRMRNQYSVFDTSPPTCKGNQNTNIQQRSWIPK